MTADFVGMGGFVDFLGAGEVETVRAADCAGDGVAIGEEVIAGWIDVQDGIAHRRAKSIHRDAISGAALALNFTSLCGTKLGVMSSLVATNVRAFTALPV